MFIVGEQIIYGRKISVTYKNIISNPYVKFHKNIFYYSILLLNVYATILKSIVYSALYYVIRDGGIQKYYY